MLSAAACLSRMRRTGRIDLCLSREERGDLAEVQTLRHGDPDVERSRDGLGEVARHIRSRIRRDGVTARAETSVISLRAGHHPEKERTADDFVVRKRRGDLAGGHARRDPDFRVVRHGAFRNENTAAAVRNTANADAAAATARDAGLGLRDVMGSSSGIPAG